MCVFIRGTPTAAGPNSFGKGNLGFCDMHSIVKKQLQQQMDELNPDTKTSKFKPI